MCTLGSLYLGSFYFLLQFLKRYLSFFFSISLSSCFLLCRPVGICLSASLSVTLLLSVFFTSFQFPAVMSKGQRVCSLLLCCQCSCLLLPYLLALAFSCCPNEQAAQHCNSWWRRKRKEDHIYFLSINQILMNFKCWICNIYWCC